MSSVKEKTRHHRPKNVILLLTLLSLTTSLPAAIAPVEDSYNQNQVSTPSVTTPIQCHIQVINDESFLTCQFPVDIRQTRKNFNVQSFRLGTDIHELAVACQWRHTLQCVGKTGVELRQEDKSINTNVTFHISTKELHSKKFSCHLAKRQYRSNNCSLPQPSNDKNTSTIVFDLSVSFGITIVAGVLISVLIFVNRKRILKIVHCKKKRKITLKSTVKDPSDLDNKKEITAEVHAEVDLEGGGEKEHLLAQVMQKEMSTQELDADSVRIKKDEDLDLLLSTLENKTIMIPAQHKNYVYAKTKLVGPKRVDILVKTKDQSHYHINDLDTVHEKTHAAFTKIKDILSPHETMAMMTQTSLDMYNETVPKTPSDTTGLSTLERIRKNKERFSDIMIINKQRGVLVGIVQSIHKADPFKVEHKLADSVSKLTVAANFIRECLITVPKADAVAVRVTLVLPNISRKQLAGQLATAVQSVTCLCEDEMATIDGLRVWWKNCWTHGQSVVMDSDLYKILLKKFALPALRVEKYLTQEASHQQDHETEENRGSVFSHWSLLPSVEKLIDFDNLDETQDDVLFLWGASGTGKTILLQLRAHQWASHLGARQIFILQTTDDGTAPACLIEHQLRTDGDKQCTFTPIDLSRQWRRKKCDQSQASRSRGVVELTEEGKRVCRRAMGLQTDVQAGSAVVHLVADDADGEVVAAVYQWLKANGAAVVRLWAAGAKDCQNGDLLPLALRDVACHVVEPLVCPKPPKGVVQGGEEQRQATVGSPAVEVLRHTRGLGRHASSAYPWRCQQCSKDIVVRFKSLSVGAADGAQGLSPNDVCVFGSEISCDKPDNDELSPAPLIGILQSTGYNVSILSTTSARDYVMSVIEKTVGPPAVTVADEKCVWGLERDVIVYCESGDPAVDMESKLRAICKTTRILIDIKSE